MNVHRIRFLELEPKAITCLAFSPSLDSSLYLAVGRSDGSIEIWSHTHGRRDFSYRRTIPGTNDSSITCLNWSGDRLFSAGLTGVINEWGVSSYTPTQSVLSVGGAIWSMDVNIDNSTLAIGCEDGQVNLYDILDGQLSYLRSLDRQNVRVLSLSWDPLSLRIITGCSDSTIRFMDTQSNRCTCRISLDKTDNEHTLVWKLKCLRDGTIVSSDSNGKVTIWEGKYGTMKQVIHVHVADVLALAVNEAEDVMFAAGVDHKILRLKKVADEDNGGVKWVQADVIRPHSHDVKSLAVSNNGILASGGVDTELCLNLIDQFHMTPTLRHSPFTSWFDCFKLAHSANYLMFQGATSLKLWKIFPKVSSDRSTSCSPDKDAIRKSLGVIDEATTCNDDRNLPLFFLEVKAATAHHIISSGLSSRGNLLAFSNIEQVWLYKMNDMGVVCLGVWPLPASAIAVNSEGESIVLCLISGGMQMASLGGSKVDFVPLLIKPEKTKKNSALFLKTQYSPCDNYLIVMDNEYRFYLYSTSDYTVIARLPCFDSNFPPSITFNSKELLIFSSCYGELYCYDIEEAALHGCGRVRRSKSRSKRRSLHMTKGLYAVPSRSNICVLYDFDSLMAVKWDRKKSDEDPRVGVKRKKTDSSGFISHDLMVDYQDVIFAGGFQNGEMVVVEKLWSDVISQLPSTICIDRYGT